MLKGHVFSEQTFDVKMFALFINQFLGGNNGIIQSYKNAMEMTNTANSITIGTGAVVVQGRFLEEHTETTVNFAKTEALYCSLVLEIDLGQTNTTTVLNQAQYKVLENSIDYPTLIQNDIINQTGNIYQFELARFQNGPMGIVNFIDRRNYLNFDSIYSGIIQNNLTSNSTTSALSANQGKILNDRLSCKITTGQEFATNEYIDGKRVYGKRIDCGALPNNSTKHVSHGISNATFVKIEGVAKDSSFTLQLCYSIPDSCVAIAVNSTIIQIFTNSDRSSYTETYITLYYTKNS